MIVSKAIRLNIKCPRHALKLYLHSPSCNHSSTNNLVDNNNSFHKRPLPNSLIPFASKEGKEVFTEALIEGTMECFFPLSEQFVTQSEPSFCALSTLAMVLNALNFDPKRTWKGIWRWVSEEMLQCESQAVCGHSIEKVKKHGMAFHDFEALAKCHGVNIKSYPVQEIENFRTDDKNYLDFRDIVIKSCMSDKAQGFVITNFSRKQLGQTGDGHFSPIAGINLSRNLVLVLDVARFKYPPYWVNIEDLWKSMSVKDATTNEPRGYFLVGTSSDSSTGEGGDVIKRMILTDNNL